MFNCLIYKEVGVAQNHQTTFRKIRQPIFLNLGSYEVPI